MRKLTGIENPSLSSLYMDEQVVTFHDFHDDSYNVFDMFFNTIKDGFDIQFCSIDYYSDQAPIVIISKDGFYENYVISNISDKKATILGISEFIKSAIDEINKKINSPEL